ncbi:MAG: mannitol dehydrogenase family protein, partial [Alphaproteobacteria bacterium]|nr:mannitol dehydrogenase family protein [Alphaproteobacteria bacterium]
DGDPDVQHDIDHPGAPRSTLGVLVRGLERRKRAQAGPLTVLCCDNLPGNGRAVAAVVEGFARRIDPALADWIQRHVSFPSTMVDRIVPATTEDDRRRAGALLGLEDAGTVVAEPFTQWVVEDRFAAGRPAWEAGGAQFVSDVAPFETMKLRLLNGSHTTMALLGFLAGHRFVREAAVDAPFRTMIQRLMAEDSAPTLSMPPGADLAAYQRALVERFANPRLDHQLKQICMDSSQKLPQRLLMAARERLKAGAVPQHIALAVAGFMRYSAGWDEAGQPIQLDDPLAAKLRAAGAAGGRDAAMLARAMFAIGEIFGTDLPQNAAFVVAVQAWLAKLLAKGAKATVAEAYG